MIASVNLDVSIVNVTNESIACRKRKNSLEERQKFRKKINKN